MPPRQLDRQHSPRPGDDRPQGACQGPERPVRERRASWPTNCGDSSRTGRSGRGRCRTTEQFWRWCKRNPWLAAANITAAALTTILAIVSTVAALIYRDQRRPDRPGQSADSAARERNAASSSSSRLQAQARAGRFSRRMGQRFDSLDALDQGGRDRPGAEAAARAASIRSATRRSPAWPCPT